MDIGFDIPRIALFIIFVVVLSPKIECQIWMQPNSPMSPLPPIQPTPLCASQFALANHACAMLPFNPVSPPSPPYAQDTSSPVNSDAPESSPAPPHRHRHRHRHRHSTQQQQQQQQSPVSQECCRWLQQIDSGCVCDLLVRLPIFLAKPGHQYTVKVDRLCTVQYSCPGRIISP